MCIRDRYKHTGDSLYYFSTKAPRCYSEVDYPDNCFLVFGKETRGLPEELLEANLERSVRLPMRQNLRSLNLSNTVAVAVYEVLRQRQFLGPVSYTHLDELPLRLPDMENFEPGEGGESPLAKIDSFVNCKCPKCGGDAKRETDTMPQWAGSSWYFLRYIDPHNTECFADSDALKYWLPVDWYNGGMEHVTRHLIYSRFWHRFLYDIRCV